MIKYLDRGAFGKVYKVFSKINHKEYAMKVIRKDQLIKHNKIKSAFREVQTMLNVEHNFLQSLDYVFQTEFRLFFVMPFLSGGDLYDNLL